MDEWKQICIRVETHAEIQAIADRDGMKLQYLADRLIRESLENHKKKELDHEYPSND
jgi:hypothetical protein